jgi:Cu-Zn family superoxide dismutase
MTSLYIQADGTGTLRFETDRFTVADLFDADGAAVMIHALPDNFANIPTRYVPEPDAMTLNTGDAGGRVACGQVE